MQRQQTTHAVSLYYDLIHVNESFISPPVSALEQIDVAEAGIPLQYVDRSVAQAGPVPVTTNSPNKTNANPEYPRVPPSSPSVTAEKAQPMTGASWKTEYTRLHEEIQIRHYSPKTLKTYRQWLRHFKAFTRSKPPESLTAFDVKEFLTWLAVKREVAAYIVT